MENMERNHAVRQGWRKCQKVTDIPCKKSPLILIWEIFSFQQKKKNGPKQAQEIFDFYVCDKSSFTRTEVLHNKFEQ